MNKKLHVIANDQLKLIAGGAEPTFGLGPAPTPPPDGHFNVGPLVVTPNIAGGSTGAIANINIGVPITNNFGIFSNTTVMTDYTNINKPVNTFGAAVVFPF